jgi:hypothetical protein
MFKQPSGQKKEGGSSGRVSMPEVDETLDAEEVFDRARRMARGEGIPKGRPARNIVVVTPGRMLMLQSCPPPGSVPKSKVQPIEEMLPPQVKRNVAAIVYTDFAARSTDMATAIPFYGFLVGFAYIGHAVWVFEGHPSALAAGCRDADVLLVDDAMIPHLQADWIAVASKVMKNAEIYVHSRATYSLRRVS